MLGRKNYTRDQVDHARSAVAELLAVYKTLVWANARATPNAAVHAELDDVERLYFNTMILVLDRYFVHRLRMVTGKDGTPLNDVEMLCDSLMHNEGILRGNNVITYRPEQAVVKLQIGDPIRLTADTFARLSAAFFAELEEKFL